MGRRRMSYRKILHQVPTVMAAPITIHPKNITQIKPIERKVEGVNNTGIYNFPNLYHDTTPKYYLFFSMIVESISLFFRPLFSIFKLITTG